MPKKLKIKSTRLWSSLMDMAKIGATKAGGCNRQALTDEDREGRDLFAGWCEEAGCSIRIDRMGNIFARRAGSDRSAPVVMTGSHLDTQPTGGKFDGVYGVLAGLEVVRTLNDHDITTTHPVEVVCWTNEEGARFPPAMIGSGVWSGEFTLKYGHSRTDRDGLSIREELQRIGYLGRSACKPGSIKAAFEAHIEQGPVLEKEGLQVGVVTGVQGMRWYDLVITGQACHAGPTPMEMRRDPVMGLNRILDKLYQLTDDFKPGARMTFGDIRTEPGSRNTVPQRIVISIDMRHPDNTKLDIMETLMREFLKNEGKRHQLEAELEIVWSAPAVQFDPRCIAAVQEAADRLDCPNMQMPSGAGHDSVYVSRVAPASMIFVPCAGGLSHNEAEKADRKDLAAGCNVLLHAMLSMASAEDNNYS